ncbi:MAG: PhzF family phenazine biosynthesis isomerase [Pseudomonadota bacterium]
MSEGILHRLTAFSNDPQGGNPAGVWVGEQLPDTREMQQIAAEVGYSETVFVTPSQGAQRIVRYYSPEAEVTFCGHATIAAGVVLGRSEGDGSYTFSTRAGDVTVTARTLNGRTESSLVSVATRHEEVSEALLKDVLRTLDWNRSDLSSAIPPVRAYAGAWHLVLAVAESDRLALLDYDFESLKQVMLDAGLTTLQLVWQERPDLFHSRNPFPVGGVVEDPATGAAAAALGGYLRDAGLITTPCRFAIRQGETMGRPSDLTVDVPASGGVMVSGSAVELHEPHAA